MVKGVQGKGGGTMNNNRRKQIRSIIERLEDLNGEIEGVQSEEREYKDNMPDNLRDSEKAEKADDVIYALDEAVENISACIENLEEAAE